MHDYKLLTDDYHRMRTVSHRVEPELIRSFGKEDIQTAARMLGLLHR